MGLDFACLILMYIAAAVPVSKSPMSTAMCAVLEGKLLSVAPLQMTAVCPGDVTIAAMWGSCRKQSVPPNVHAFVTHLWQR